MNEKALIRAIEMLLENQSRILMALAVIVTDEEISKLCVQSAELTAAEQQMFVTEAS